MTATQIFDWKEQAEAEALILTWLNEACAQNSQLAQFNADLTHKTSTRLLDWVDHLTLGATNHVTGSLQSVGFEAVSQTCYRHPGAILPAIHLAPNHDRDLIAVSVVVEDICHYQQAHGFGAEIEGSCLGGLRRSTVSVENGVAFNVVERRAYLGMEPTHESASDIQSYLHARELWMTRPRGLQNEDEAMRLTQQRAEEMVRLVGKDLAAWIAMEGERWYWESRNRAGQIQKARQDLLGMGWANHDHHTFRSSRRLFQRLVHLFETLGFHCRERFYAGEQAGWGAQVMENTTCNLVLFLDVDLAPEEVEIDYAHEQLPERNALGTIGLWCALHGDSILRAGMHHLEAQFAFDDLTKDLHEIGVGMMKPFSNFSYLKQAFTEGEIWPVAEHKIKQLLSKGFIEPAQAEHFAKYGAIGSHLENLERNNGYKGFNQNNVSYIIKKTDPREQVTHS